MIKIGRINTSIRLFGFILCLQILVIYKPNYANNYSGVAYLESNYELDDLKNPRYVGEKEPEKVRISSITSIKAENINERNYEGVVVEIIKKYAREFNLNENDLLKISYCESGFNPEARNGDYGGIFQFSTSTWISNRKAMGLDPNPKLRFEPEEASKTAAFKMSRDGYGAWPECSNLLLAGK